MERFSEGQDHSGQNQETSSTPSSLLQLPTPLQPFIHRWHSTSSSFPSSMTAAAVHRGLVSCEDGESQGYHQPLANMH